MKDKHHRPIQSFVRREGRITDSQRRALSSLWEKYGLNYSRKLLNFSELFGRQADIILEIGFGNGDSLSKMAANTPKSDFLGIEVYRPGVGHLLSKIEAAELKNLRVICDDAVRVLEDMIPDALLSKVQIFFPDPWPKKRHHKRRLIQMPFVMLLHKKLKAGGIVHLATDWEDYAKQMVAVFSEANEEFYQEASSTNRPTTKFERRGLRLDHQIWDLLFIKKKEQV